MWVKICCIKNKRELVQVLDEGVDFVGFVSHMPSGPGIIPENLIRHLALYTPKSVDTFLLTSLTDPHDIAAQWRYVRTTTVQLCRPMSSKDITTLRAIAPGVRIVSVIHVEGEQAKDIAKTMEQVNDGILLDSGCANGNPPKLGGTGITHDWRISREITSVCKKTTWLAGGLTVGNVGKALVEVMPGGVDVCSGVRTDDILDHKKLREFLQQVRFQNEGDGSKATL